MKRLAAVLLCAVFLAGLTTVTALGQDDDAGSSGGKQTVFDVGDPQGIDSMSP